MMIKAILTKPLDGHPEGAEREFSKGDFERLKAKGAVRDAREGKAAPDVRNKKAPAVANKSGSPVLRDDGPTVAEYVAAGYLASNYPPEGYASRSTDEEIAAAVADESAKAELEKLTNKQLQELAKQEDIAVEGDDNKATLVGKILAGRAAKA